jgi:hypothetical protein
METGVLIPPSIDISCEFCETEADCFCSTCVKNLCSNCFEFTHRKKVHEKEKVVNPSIICENHHLIKDIFCLKCELEFVHPAF